MNTQIPNAAWKFMTLVRDLGSLGAQVTRATANILHLTDPAKELPGLFKTLDSLGVNGLAFRELFDADFKPAAPAPPKATNSPAQASAAGLYATAAAKLGAGEVDWHAAPAANLSTTGVIAGALPSSTAELLETLQHRARLCAENTGHEFHFGPVTGTGSGMVICRNCYAIQMPLSPGTGMYKDPAAYFADPGVRLAQLLGGISALLEFRGVAAMMAKELSDKNPWFTFDVALDWLQLQYQDVLAASLAEDENRRQVAMEDRAHQGGNPFSFLQADFEDAEVVANSHKIFPIEAAPLVASSIVTRPFFADMPQPDEKPDAEQPVGGERRAGSRKLTREERAERLARYHGLPTAQNSNQPTKEEE